MPLFKKTTERAILDSQLLAKKNEIITEQNSKIKDPDAFNLATFLSKDELKVDWSHRRSRIDGSLVFFGFIITLIISCLLIAVFFNKTIDPNYSYIFSGALMFVLLSYVTVLGQYTLGPLFESNALRKSAADMYNNMINKKFESNLPSTGTPDNTPKQHHPFPHSKHRTIHRVDPNPKPTPSPTDSDDDNSGKAG